MGPSILKDMFSEGVRVAVSTEGTSEPLKGPEREAGTTGPTRVVCNPKTNKQPDRADRDRDSRLSPG